MVDGGAEAASVREWSSAGSKRKSHVIGDRLGGFCWCGVSDGSSFKLR